MWVNIGFAVGCLTTLFAIVVGVLILIDWIKYEKLPQFKDKYTKKIVGWLSVQHDLNDRFEGLAKRYSRIHNDVLSVRYVQTCTDMTLNEQAKDLKATLQRIKDNMGYLEKRISGLEEFGRQGKKTVIFLAGEQDKSNHRIMSLEREISDTKADKAFAPTSIYMEPSKFAKKKKK